jgi:hypothetical protein
LHHSPLHQAMGLLLPTSLLRRPMGHLGAEMEEAMVMVRHPCQRQRLCSTCARNVAENTACPCVRLLRTQTLGRAKEKHRIQARERTRTWAPIWAKARAEVRQPCQRQHPCRTSARNVAENTARPCVRLLRTQTLGRARAKHRIPAMVMVAKTSSPDLAVYVTLLRSPLVSTVGGPYVPARTLLPAADPWASPGGMLSLLL